MASCEYLYQNTEGCTINICHLQDINYFKNETVFMSYAQLTV